MHLRFSCKVKYTQTFLIFIMFTFVFYYLTYCVSYDCDALCVYPLNLTGFLVANDNQLAEFVTYLHVCAN